MSENLYTYGIIEQEDIEMDIEGVQDAETLYTVDYRTLSALVSEIDTTEPERTDEDVQRHNRVLQQVLEFEDGRTVVPMSFGMAFKNSRTIKGVIRGARRALRSALNDIDGMIELGVKVITVQEDMINEAELRSDIVEQLSAVSVNETENDLFSDRLILNKSYLVDRSNRSEFDEAIEAIESTHTDSVKIQYTGPWAAYNFVDIHIGAEQSGR